MGRLEITILRGRGFGKGSDDLPNTYVKIKDGAKKYKTPVIDGSAAPEWNETFVLELEPGAKPLLVEVFHNAFFGNTCLGKVYLDYQSLTKAQPQEGWFDLQQPDDEWAGMSSALMIRMIAHDFGLEPTPQPAPAPAASSPPAQAKEASPASTAGSYRGELAALMAKWRSMRSSPADAAGLTQVFQGSAALREVTASSTLPGVENLDKILRASFKRYDLDDSDTLNTSEELLLLCTNLSFKFRLKMGEIELEEICSSCITDAPVESWPFETFAAWFKLVFLHGLLNSSPAPAPAAPMSAVS